MKIIEHHRVPLGPQITLLYQRQESSRAPLSVECCFRMGYADGVPGQVYALMKAFQGQYAPAWRPRLMLTPDWARLSFSASSEYRRALDEQWLQLFELESALTELEPLKHGLMQEQRLIQESVPRALELAFQRFAFAGTPYDRPPLGEPGDLEQLGQEELLDTFLHLLTRAPVYLRLRDHLPLHQVIDRIRPLLGRQRGDLWKPEPVSPELSGPREQSLRLKLDGALIDIGFVMPGMDHPGWIYGPLFEAWLRDVWQAEPASPALQLLDLKWLPWQRASLLTLRLHSSQAAELPEHKLRLLQWLVQARQGYLTSRRLRQACMQASQAWLADKPPLHVERDEMLDGWGHGRHKMHQVSLQGFQQAFGRYLNADHWVLQDVCSPAVSVRLQPDHRKEMTQLGFAPRKAAPAGSQARCQELKRLHLSPHWSMWLIPQAGLPHLELGLWFASGSAGDLVPGTTRLLFELLGQRFMHLLHALDERGAVRSHQSWQTGVTRDYCFFRWSTSWSELPQALQLLQGLLQDLPVDQPRLQALKQGWQARLQAGALDPMLRASEQFTLSGFANHPYAFPTGGSYLSLQQLGPDSLRQRWRELRQSALANPILSGTIPASLDADQLGPALAAILDQPVAPPGPPAARVRRGEIQATAEPRGFRLEGQLFAEALPLEQHCTLQLGLQWMQDQLRSRYGIPLEVRSETLRQAWYFAFAGLYSREERMRWLHETRSISEPLDMLKQRLQAELRGRQLSASAYWPDLVHWLSLGGTPGSYADREHQLLALHREDVEAFITRSLTQENEWLQVVFQGVEDKVGARRF